MNSFNFSHIKKRIPSVKG